MGNCLVILDEKRVIKVLKPNGEILRYQSPFKVHQALSKFPGHSISNALPVVQHLDPMADMLSGQLYYLLPPPPAPGGTVKPALKAGVVRIKLVLSKEELKEILSKGGVSLGAMLSHLQREPSKDVGCGNKDRYIGWRPALDSIPEGNIHCSETPEY